MKIKKISDLAKANPTVLIEAFGKFGAELSKIARGEDDSGVIEGGVQVSIGREVTLDNETDDINDVSETMEKLTKEAIDELGKRKLWYRNVAGKVRYSDFTVRTKAKRLSNFTDSYDTALGTSMELVRELLAGGKARKVGIRLSEFSEQEGQAKL